MAAVMIGVDPHKGSHTAMAPGADEGDAYPRLGVHRRRRRRGLSHDPTAACLEDRQRLGSCRGPFHPALRKVPASVCPMSRIGHTRGILTKRVLRDGLRMRPL